MNSPYMGKFRVSQEYKGPSVHDGLDLVGVDSKDIHCVATGKVIKAGWENPNNKKQGFGMYVKIQTSTNDIWYYGHLSKINVELGQTVKVTQKIGVEGSTGHSTGSHLHICVRPNGVKANARNVASILNIPNKLGTYDDGYSSKQSTTNTTAKTTTTTTTNTSTATNTNTSTSNSTTAKSYNKSLSGSYKTTTALNFRKSPNGEIIMVIPSNATVRCYGYYTNEWYSVIYNNMTGFVSSKYLKKV